MYTDFQISKQKLNINKEVNILTDHSKFYFVYTFMYFVLFQLVMRTLKLPQAHA